MASDAPRFIVRPAAEADIEEAALWYELRSSGLGADFLRAVDVCFEQIRRRPEGFQQVYKSARRARIDDSRTSHISFRRLPISRSSRVCTRREIRGSGSDVSTANFRIQATAAGRRLVLFEDEAPTAAPDPERYAGKSRRERCLTGCSGRRCAPPLNRSVRQQCGRLSAMDISKSRPDLRRLLNEITRSPRDEHPARIGQLGTVHQHGIKLALATDTPTTPPDKYTCFMHAFDLVNSRPVIEIARTFAVGENETYPTGAFVAYLVDRHLSEILHEEAQNGDIVVYSCAAGIAHAGKFSGGKVISKWGTGLLWEHAVDEVPSAYGDDVSFFHAPPWPIAEQAFVAYARQREGADVVDLLLGPLAKSRAGEPQA